MLSAALWDRAVDSGPLLRCVSTAAGGQTDGPANQQGAPGFARGQVCTEAQACIHEAEGQQLHDTGPRVRLAGVKAADGLAPTPLPMLFRCPYSYYCYLAPLMLPTIVVGVSAWWGPGLLLLRESQATGRAGVCGCNQQHTDSCRVALQVTLNWFSLKLFKHNS